MLEIMFEKLEKLEEKVATKECIQSLMTIINEQKETLARMENKITALEIHIDHLGIANDKLEGTKGDCAYAFMELIYHPL